jgi:hypothetical protein
VLVFYLVSVLKYKPSETYINWTSHMQPPTWEPLQRGDVGNMKLLFW